MATIKTAISIQKPLFEQMDALARDMKTSRSHLIVLALEEFIRRYQNRQLLDRINVAYADEPDPGEQALARKMRRQHRRIIEGHW